MLGRFCVVASVTLMLVATGCAPGAGAESPPVEETPVSGDLAGSRAAAIPTSTPWPRFGPPVVTASEVTAIAQFSSPTPFASASIGGPSGSTGSSAPGPEPGAGTPTTVIARPTPTVIATPAFPVTPPDTSGTFVPAVSYDYLVPDEWQVVVGDDEILIEDLSGNATVTLREHRVDRSRIGSLRELVLTDQPEEFTDWTERSLSDSVSNGELTHLFSYSGTKYGEPYVAIVQWRLRGELLIEVTTEATAAGWAGDSRVRNAAALSAASFAPLPDVPLSSVVEIENQLMVKFAQMPSGVFQPSNSRNGRTELTCREVFHDLLSSPVYTGAGTWQVFAVGDQSAQVWQVFEPSLSILPADHNTSTC